MALDFNWQIYGPYDGFNVSPFGVSIVAFRFCRYTDGEQSWTEQFQKPVAAVVFRACVSWLALAVYVPHPFPSISWPVS